MENAHVIVLFGATGDLARRKLLPGTAAPVARPACSTTPGSSAPRWRTIDTETFVKMARESCDEFCDKPVSDARVGADFGGMLSYVPQSTPVPRRWPRRSARPRPSSRLVAATSTSCTT